MPFSINLYPRYSVCIILFFIQIGTLIDYTSTGSPAMHEASFLNYQTPLNANSVSGMCRHSGFGKEASRRRGSWSTAHPSAVEENIDYC